MDLTRPHTCRSRVDHRVFVVQIVCTALCRSYVGDPGSGSVIAGVFKGRTEGDLAARGFEEATTNENIEVVSGQGTMSSGVSHLVLLPYGHFYPTGFVYLTV